MNTWNQFKYAYKEYYCHSSDSKINGGMGIYQCLSEINNYYFNYIFIDNYFSSNKNPLEDANKDLVVLSFPEKRKNISQWSDKNKFLGTGAIMTKHSNTYKSIEVSNDINLIKVHKDISYLNDYIVLLSQVKSINKENLSKMFNKDYIKSSNIHMYLAYLNDKPVGALAAVIIDNCAFSVDSAILEEHRNTKILTSLGEFAMQEGIENNISKYSCLVTSQYTMKLVEKQGYVFDMPCDVWIYNK